MHHEKDACLQSESWSTKSSVSWLDLSWEHSFHVFSNVLLPCEIV